MVGFCIFCERFVPCARLPLLSSPCSCLLRRCRSALGHGGPSRHHAPRARRAAGRAEAVLREPARVHRRALGGSRSLARRRPARRARRRGSESLPRHRRSRRAAAVHERPSRVGRVRREYGLERANKMGRLPWRIEEIYRLLVTRFREVGKGTPAYAADNARYLAAVLAHYVEDAHQPFHAVLNYDGQLTGQRGIHSRFETELVAAQPRDASAGAGRRSGRSPTCATSCSRRCRERVARAGVLDADRQAARARVLRRRRTSRRSSPAPGRRSSSASASRPAASRARSSSAWTGGQARPAGRQAGARRRGFAADRTRRMDVYLVPVGGERHELYCEVDRRRRRRRGRPMAPGRPGGGARSIASARCSPRPSASACARARRSTAAAERHRRADHAQDRRGRRRAAAALAPAQGSDGRLMHPDDIDRRARGRAGARRIRWRPHASTGAGRSSTRCSRRSSGRCSSSCRGRISSRGTFCSAASAITSRCAARQQGL